MSMGAMGSQSPRQVRIRFRRYGNNRANTDWTRLQRPSLLVREQAIYGLNSLYRGTKTYLSMASI